MIGFGGIAAGLGEDPLMAQAFAYPTHASVLAKHPAFSWEAVVDLSDKALEQASENWQIPICVRDVEELASRYDPEIAVITIPSDLRLAELNHLKSLRAVIAEKPLGMKLMHAEQFVQTCEQRNLVVQVNYWRRGAVGLRDLAASLFSHTGRPQAAFATYGGGLFNNGSHIIDFVRMLLGEVISVQAYGPPCALDNPALKGDVHIPFLLCLECGANVFVAPLEYENYREVGLDIWGERGRLTLFQETLLGRHYPIAENRGLTGEREIATDAGAAVDTRVSNALYDLYDNLAANLSIGADLWSSGSSALQSEAVVDAVLRSAECRQSVALH